MQRDQTWRSSLFFAFVGAVLATLVDVLIRGPANIQSLDYLGILTSTLVGAILGWVFDLARGLQSVLSEALQRLENLSRALEYQQSALDILLKDRRHTRALTALIKDSVQDKFRNIPYVDRNTYHTYLAMAIEQSERFEGVQDKTIRWYREHNEGGYLQKIKARKIAIKRRIFIIPERHRDQMRQDLDDYETMRYYWQNTGEDVSSYWIAADDLKRNFPHLSNIVGDFGLYDNSLLIRYDLQHMVVVFDLISTHAQEHRLFEALDNQIQQGFSEPFILIDPQDLARLKGAAGSATPE